MFAVPRGTRSRATNTLLTPAIRRAKLPFRLPFREQEGDKVLLPEYGGTQVKIDDKE